MVLSGCGFVGIRETSALLAERRQMAIEHWYSAETGELVGRSTSSTERGLGCQGTLPPPDCEFETCVACGPDSSGRRLVEGCDYDPQQGRIVTLEGER
jgi:hypothetical protein